MEYFDIVDENGIPTGDVVERKTAHRDGIRHRTAHVWIIREREGKTEILLQKRAQGKDSFPGYYDTSSAGHIQAGDEPLISALRELEEELGICSAENELDPIGTFRIDYEKEFYGEMFRDHEVAFVFLYRKDIDDSSLVLQEEEVERVDWFDLEATYQECIKGSEMFCVPIGGLELIRAFFRK